MTLRYGMTSTWACCAVSQPVSKVAPQSKPQSETALAPDPQPARQQSWRDARQTVIVIYIHPMGSNSPRRHVSLSLAVIRSVAGNTALRSIQEDEFRQSSSGRKQLHNHGGGGQSVGIG